MKDMEYMLEETFCKVLKDYKVKYIGKSVYIELDNERIIELSFYDKHNAEIYLGIKMELFNKFTGKLHSQVVEFESIFYNIKDESGKIKLIQYNQVNSFGYYEWDAKITELDLNAMEQTVKKYIELWK